MDSYTTTTNLVHMLKAYDAIKHSLVHKVVTDSYTVEEPGFGKGGCENIHPLFMTETYFTNGCYQKWPN